MFRPQEDSEDSDLKRAFVPRMARRQLGMTLIELLVVITISAILLAVGVPMFNATIAGSKVAGAASDIRGALELARSEAIRRGVPVSVCRVTDANASAPSCNNAAVVPFAAGDWALGWVIFAESDATGTVGVFNPFDTVILRQNSASAGSRAVITGNVVSVSFGPEGLRQAAAGTTASFTVASSDPTSPRTRYVCVGVTGQIIGQTTACPTP